VASVRIVNASPLILLGKIRRLDLLHERGREVLAPDAVFKEVEDPAAPGLLPGWDASVPPILRAGDVTVPPEVERFALDPGETMVLALALDRQAAGDDVEVVLDEKRGRRAAKALALPLIGTAALLVRAKADGRVAAVAPLLDELEAQGMYLGEPLRRDILDLADE
jgi:predicted nucleic acid-binding protein